MRSSGFVRDGFSAVGEAFEKNFEEGLELGACFAVVIDGETVVDIRGGFSDKVKETPWTEDTLACIYSSGKAVLSFLMARAVSDGLLDYDAPVAQYWSDFAAEGKEDITVAQMLSHQAGLCGFPEEMSPETWLDWDAICAKLAVMAPLWEPGTANGYHPQTVGFMAGELLRRVTGKSVGQHIEGYEASDGLQIFCGMRADQMARAAYMPKPPKAPDLGTINEFKQAAFLKPWSAPAKVAREDWMAAELPASNMHADARSLAKIVHPFANSGNWTDGDPCLSREAIDAALAERIRGDDLVLPFHLSWAAGLMRNINRHFGPNENAFGHAGFGGSCIVVDPENNLTAAYVMNKMSPSLVGDPRAVRLLDAVYTCL
ncbi:serine hydrolase domain-containing protein [Hyphococcus luteus]|uniref:Esterase n=1 Tax=Hyphococcus luteus TaxID=2058213 RepID=A0A2S7K7V4_9PROT|nr:serine hydrolase domain-containing protein [Marinicaulis flavus]PQA88572.1 esterase [Marinicaulis flavus]